MPEDPYSTKSSTRIVPASRPHVLELLLSLARGPAHGYALMHDIELRTGGAIRIGPATMYRTLAELADGQLVVRTAAPPEAPADAERRQYVALTGLGEAVLAAEVSRLRAIVAEATLLNVCPDPA